MGPVGIVCVSDRRQDNDETHVAGAETSRWSSFSPKAGAETETHLLMDRWDGRISKSELINLYFILKVIVSQTNDSEQPSDKLKLYFRKMYLQDG